MYQLHESELDDYNKRQKFLTPSLSSKPVYRRCVVINGGRESSQCLQIKTYEGEGCTRRDVRSLQHHHAAVYTGHEAFYLPEETHLRMPIQADPISHDTLLPRLARLNYDSLFDLSHTRPIYPLAQVTPRSLRTLLHDLEELNPPTIRPLRPTRKRTWDVVLEQLNVTTISPPTAAPHRPVRAPVRRAPTYPPPIPETPPPQPAPRIEIVAPRPEATLFPVVPRGAPAVRVPLTLHSARDSRSTAPVSALCVPRAAELNFIDADLAARLGATQLRYAGPDVVMPGSGARVPATGAVKVKWRFEGMGRECVDTFVVFPGLPGEVVLGSKTVVERRWGMGNREAEMLRLPVLGREERRKMEQDDRNKSDRRRREEARENAEIERWFARQRAALLR